jgi:hypothetical protein
MAHREDLGHLERDVFVFDCWAVAWGSLTDTARYLVVIDKEVAPDEHACRVAASARGVTP